MKSLFLITVVLICGAVGLAQVSTRGRKPILANERFTETSLTEGCFQTPEDVQLGRVVHRNWSHIDCEPQVGRVVSRIEWDNINAEIVQWNGLPSDYKVVLESDLENRVKALEAKVRDLESSTLRISPGKVGNGTPVTMYAHAPQQKGTVSHTWAMTIDAQTIDNFRERCKESGDCGVYTDIRISIDGRSRNFTLNELRHRLGFPRSKRVLPVPMETKNPEAAPAEKLLIARYAHVQQKPAAIVTPPPPTIYTMNAEASADFKKLEEAKQKLQEQIQQLVAQQVALTTGSGIPKSEISKLVITEKGKLLEFSYAGTTPVKSEAPPPTAPKEN